ncbi:MAG TPA: dihydroneopterin aldolase [Porticoccaceae bacterium]|nr:dihydroneopterin aldolase [Porticoccaceae bacterium]|tara:strand:+ start:1306 stop:1662 length:357 start_codon:yes stop_codon:yes gene_type:complete
MDIVYIRDLRIETIIGIYEWERQVKQIVSFDLEMAANISEAARTDDIQYALNYKSIAKRIISFIQASEFLLVERMADEVATIVIEEFDVPWLRLRVSKPGALRGAQDVGIIIERGVKT